VSDISLFCLYLVSADTPECQLQVLLGCLELRLHLPHFNNSGKLPLLITMH
jgi:hypothetical protein